MEKGSDKYHTAIMGYIEEALDNVVEVHGQITKVVKQGNSVIIVFVDGAVYKQPLVTRESVKAVFDSGDTL